MKKAKMVEKIKTELVRDNSVAAVSIFLGDMRGREVNMLAYCDGFEEQSSFSYSQSRPEPSLLAVLGHS